ncbi:hypothetical protein [Sulfurospirillum sp. 1612]|uniref:hypothetical protein n=1 Tax=Sulfurospirillum sp. 1612 TaxID=3094835 RepID=UPI002F954331
MFPILSSILGIFQDPIKKAASKWFETAQDKAQATAIYLKALDPNGQMRRSITTTTMRLYSTYIYVMLFLLLAQSFNLGNTQQISSAISSMKDLFLPITTAFGTIMSASFAVNGVNSFTDGKIKTNTNQGGEK